MGISATFFWIIFEATGSISAYLAYKDFCKFQTNQDQYIV